MMQPSLLDQIDICANRHKGAETSRVAHDRVKHTKQAMYLRIENLLRNRSMTSKEIAIELDKPLHAISGRLAELKMLGRIEDTKVRRAGAAELRIRT